MSFYPYNYIGPVVEQTTGPVTPTEPLVYEDYLEWGADWITDQSQQFASQDVTVSWTESGITRTELMKASLVDEDGRVIRGQVRAAIEYTYFMFVNQDLINKDVPLERGAFIEWDSKQYEVVIGKNKNVSANDTHQRTIVVGTKHVLNRDRRSSS